jgi:hypothetical protein
MLEVGALSLAAQSAIRTEWRPIGGSAALPAPPRQMPTIRASDRTDDGVVPAAADAPQAPPYGGHPCDSLELGEDNVLRPVSAGPPRASARTGVAR